MILLSNIKQKIAASTQRDYIISQIKTNIHHKSHSLYNNTTKYIQQNFYNVGVFLYSSKIHLYYNTRCGVTNLHLTYRAPDIATNIRAKQKLILSYMVFITFAAFTFAMKLISTRGSASSSPLFPPRMNSFCFLICQSRREPLYSKVIASFLSPRQLHSNCQRLTL